MLFRSTISAILFSIILIADSQSTPLEPIVWKTLNASHYWDCNGAACDSRTLQPWDQNKYRYAATYAPVDPASYGGALYGEKMWMTGAPNDALSSQLGANDLYCGQDPSGGCGKCLLVQNPTAFNKDWTVLVMKKNRCPPQSNGCGPNNIHLDLAAPGYDNLQYSTANICGQPSTFLSRAQSSVCGSWWTKGANTITGCICSSLPSTTAMQKILKKGCQLFTSWGWTSGNPQLKYRIVACPPRYRDLIHNAFDKNGVTNKTA